MQGMQISHYRLERLLGSGTYGQVYAAVHVHDPELCAAVKVVHASLATDQEFVSSLKRECRVLSRLQHTHLVGFRDLVLSASHPPALVLELLEGSDLAEWSARGPMPPDEALRLARELLTGLAYAHKKGVVHRDIKPSNAFLTTDGEVKLLDFGLAKAADNSHATQSGQIQGTLDYMASELFDGVKASPSTDVYAAGLVLWELLAGGPACPAGSMMKKMGWHTKIGAPTVQAVAPSVPTELADAVRQLTGRKGRPADGAAALALLDRVSLDSVATRRVHRPGTVTLPGKRAAAAAGAAPAVERPVVAAPESLPSVEVPSPPPETPVTARRSAAPTPEAPRRAEVPSTPPPTSGTAKVVAGGAAVLGGGVLLGGAVLVGVVVLFLAVLILLPILTAERKIEVSLEGLPSQIPAFVQIAGTTLAQRDTHRFSFSDQPVGEVQISVAVGVGCEASD